MAAHAQFSRTRSAPVRIVRRTLGLIAAEGVDSVSASSAALAAGVSRPTLYSYFGDVQGLFADCWLFAGQDWLEILLQGEAEPADLPPDINRALAELLAVAPRVPELREVVVPDLQRLWRQQEQAGPVALTRAMWILALQVGVSLTRTINPETQKALLAVPLVQRLSACEPPTAEPQVLPEEAPPVRIAPAFGWLSDETTSELLNATVTVVASAGVAHASMMRICRAARVSSGAAKTRFRHLADLISAGFDYALAQVVKQNLALVSKFSGAGSIVDAYALTLESSFDPARAVWRRYRQELYIAAQQNGELADKLRDANAQSDTLLGQAGRTMGLGEQGVAVGLALNHALAIGFPALYHLGLPVDRLDHRAVLAHIASALEA